MPQINFAAVPSEVSVTEARINELSASAVETAAAFTRRIESLFATYAEAQNRFNSESASFVEGADPQSRSIAQRLAKQTLAQKVIKYRRALVESSANGRGELLAKLKALADEADAISAVCASPASMLGRTALGEPRKTQLIQQLQDAGPTELETAARMAIYSNDVVLAAAIAVVCDRRPRDRRPFSVAEFAQRVMGPVFDEANRKLEGVRLAYRTAIAADLEFQRGAPSTLTNISLGLSRRAAAQAAGNTSEA